MATTVNQRVICIIHPNKAAYSETFIRAHLERVPATVKFLYGGYFPRYQADDRPLLSTAPPQRLTRAVLRRAFGLPGSHFRNQALQRYLSKNKVDAVLAEIGPVGVEVMDVCRQAGVPLLVYFRGADAYAEPILEQVGPHYPRLFENAAAIFVVSRALERHLAANLGAPRAKLYYNPSGVDGTLFQGADPAHTAPVFLAVGRLVDNKGPQLTLRALARTVEHVSDARLIMIGDGPLLEPCRQLARELELNHAVDFLGPRPQQEVAAVMRQARALIQHSIRTRNGAEGTPNALKEAGMSGLPVVATRVGGIPEIVIDGETGFLVDEGDVEAMARHMIRLAQDAALAAKLGQAARDWVHAEFSMEKSIDRLWRTTETIIREHRSQA